MQKIEALLDGDSVAADHAEGLAKQLDAQHELLQEPLIAQAAQHRGGPASVVELGARAAGLRHAAQAKAEPRGTPAETELLDLVDGLILGLTRGAREAAEAAARELGEPAIETAFELSALYKRRAPKKDDAPGA